MHGEGAVGHLAEAHAVGQRHHGGDDIHVLLVGAVDDQVDGDARPGVGSGLQALDAAARRFDGRDDPGQASGLGHQLDAQAERVGGEGGGHQPPG